MRPAFRVMQVPVYIPPSAAVGIALIGYFALPTARSLTTSNSNAVTLTFIALLHALVLYTSILVHEIGHVYAARHYQYPVEKVVIHVIGGHTAFKNRFTQPRHQFVVAIAGPIANMLYGVFGFLLGVATTDSLIKSLAAWVVWGAVIGGFLNLLPGYPLDGGAALSALVWYRTRDQLLGQKVSARGGFVISALWITFPIFLGVLFSFQPTFADFLIPWFLGVWMSFNAWAQLQTLKNVKKIDESSPNEWTLRVQRCVPVSAETSCEEVQRILLSEKAHTALVVGPEGVQGIVNRELLGRLDSIQATNTEALQISRRTFPSDFISRYISKVEFQNLSKQDASNEWIVLDAMGRIYGIAYRDEQEINDEL